MWSLHSTKDIPYEANFNVGYYGLRCAQLTSDCDLFIAYRYIQRLLVSLYTAKKHREGHTQPSDGNMLKSFFLLISFF